MTDSDALPGDSLVALADKLNAAVVQAFKDGLYDECVVDMTPFGIEECYGRGGGRVSSVSTAIIHVHTATCRRRRLLPHLVFSKSSFHIRSPPVYQKDT